VDSTQASVAVVGGGIIGSCVAFCLAKKGVDVVVLDPAPGAGASAGNSGMLVPSQTVPFANPASVGAWLGALARRESAISLFHTAAALRRQHQVWRTLRELGAEYELLGPRALRDAEPGLRPDLAGAVGFPGDRSLDPARTTLAVADAARAHGARFLAESVVGARRRGDRVDAVTTDRGTVTAGWFVVAAGAASARVGRFFGARLPVRAGYGLSLTYPAERPLLRHAVTLEEAHIVIASSAGSVRLTTGWSSAVPRATSRGPMPSGGLTRSPGPPCPPCWHGTPRGRRGGAPAL
jgi:D-amino-acid dehydrogenase